MPWLQNLFGGEDERPGRETEGGILPPEEIERIGTEEVLLVG